MTPVAKSLLPSQRVLNRKLSERCGTKTKPCQPNKLVNPRPTATPAPGLEDVRSWVCLLPARVLSFNLLLCGPGQGAAHRTAHRAAQVHRAVRRRWI